MATPRPARHLALARVDLARPSPLACSIASSTCSIPSGKRRSTMISQLSGEIFKFPRFVILLTPKLSQLLEKERELTSLLTYHRSAITSKESLITSTSTLISQLKIIDTENFKEFNNQICKLIGVRGGVEEEEEVFLRRIREMEELEALERIENGGERKGLRH